MLIIICVIVDIDGKLSKTLVAIPNTVLYTVDGHFRHRVA